MLDCDSGRKGPSYCRLSLVKWYLFRYKLDLPGPVRVIVRRRAAKKADVQTDMVTPLKPNHSSEKPPLDYAIHLVCRKYSADVTQDPLFPLYFLFLSFFLRRVIYTQNNPCR
jgi:hypothetical protein